jgi:hypothetical protein
MKIIKIHTVDDRVIENIDQILISCERYYKIKKKDGKIMIVYKDKITTEEVEEC